MSSSLINTVMAALVKENFVQKKNPYGRFLDELFS